MDFKIIALLINGTIILLNVNRLHKSYNVKDIHGIVYYGFLFIGFICLLVVIKI